MVEQLGAVLAIQIDDVIAGRLRRGFQSARGCAGNRVCVLDAFPHRMPDIVAVDGLVQATLNAGLVAITGPILIAYSLAVGHVLSAYSYMLYIISGVEAG